MKNIYFRNFTTNHTNQTNRTNLLFDIKAIVRGVRSVRVGSWLKIIIFSLLFSIGFSAGSSAFAQTLFLPITGVQTEEARTIAAFLKMTFDLNVIDQSLNSALAPAGGRAWGIGPGARDNIVNLINQNGAKNAIGINVVPSGTGKIATIRRFSETGILTEMTDIQYGDPFEFWIKLQLPAETTRRADGGKVWVVYRSGVNRAEAEELIQLWFSDLVSMGAQGLKELDDQTAGFEAAMRTLDSQNDASFSVNWMATIDDMIRYYRDLRITARSGTPFYTVTAGSPFNTGYLQLIVRSIPQGYVQSLPDLIINVSRQGNRTRVEAVRRNENTNGAFVFEYDSAAQFRRMMRINSLRFMDALYKDPLEYARDDAIRSTWITSASLTELRSNVPVPSSFVQVRRPPAAAGEVSRSGFYMSSNLVTQREFETLMGTNPSPIKGPNLPVYNVSRFDIMEYCNRLSLRDGLMPVYEFFFWEGIRTRRQYVDDYYYAGQKESITINPYANGYRLPTASEWDFALTGGGQSATNFINWLYEIDAINDLAWVAANSGGRPQPVGQKGTINGFRDLLGNIRETVEDDEPRGGDYLTPVFLDYITQENINPEVDIWVAGIAFNNNVWARAYGYRIMAGDKGMGRMLNRTEAEAAARAAGSRRLNVDSIIAPPGFRIVRPMFDYWAYRGTGTGTQATTALASIAETSISFETPEQLEAWRLRAVQLTREREAARMDMIKRDAINEARRRYAERREAPDFTEALPYTEQKDAVLVIYAGIPGLQSGEPYLFRQNIRVPNVLTEIHISGDIMTFYLESVDRFDSYPQNILLLNMDNNEMYHPSELGRPAAPRGRPTSSLTFTGVTGSRFTLISVNVQPVIYFDDIYIGNEAQRAQKIASRAVFTPGTYTFNPRLPLMQDGKAVAYLDRILMYEEFAGSRHRLITLRMYFTKTPNTPWAAGTNDATDILRYIEGENYFILKNLDNGRQRTTQNFNLIEVRRDDIEAFEGNRFSFTNYFRTAVAGKPRGWTAPSNMVIEEFDLSKAELTR